MSEVITDKLTGRATAGNVTITSEGGAATMQLQQGVAKAWLNWDTGTSHSTRDSVNVSSISDGGTGVTTITFTSSMSNSNYQSMFFSSASIGSNTGSFANDFAGSNGINRTASSCIMGSYYNAYADATHNDWSILGDLA